MRSTMQRLTRLEALSRRKPKKPLADFSALSDADLERVIQHAAVTEEMLLADDLSDEQVQRISEAIAMAEAAGAIFNTTQRGDDHGARH